jgi:hypothetical protein
MTLAIQQQATAISEGKKALTKNAGWLLGKSAELVRGEFVMTGDLPGELTLFDDRWITQSYLLTKTHQRCRFAAVHEFKEARNPPQKTHISAVFKKNARLQTFFP